MAAFGIWTVLAGFFSLAAAAYPLTQFYQYEEDRAHGDRTLVIALGKQRSLYWSLAFVSLAFCFFVGAARLYHPTPWSWALLAAYVEEVRVGQQNEIAQTHAGHDP